MIQRNLVLAAAASLALSACNNQPAAEAPTLHEVMKDQIDANADALWDVTNSAVGDEGGINPALMTDGNWTKAADLAEAVAVGAEKLAAMQKIVVAKPGVKVSDEGQFGHSAAEVQANVDKDPELLREMATALAAHMRDFEAAARAKDAAKAGPLIDQLDGVCENCHLEFWYPDQKALVEQYRNAVPEPPK